MPGNTELRVYFGIGLADQRRYVDAAKQFDEARRRGLATAEVLLYLGSALREAGRLEEATTRLREAVALAPGNAAPHQSLIGLEGEGPAIGGFGLRAFAGRLATSGRESSKTCRA